jgi:hypothetical protein
MFKIVDPRLQPPLVQSDLEGYCKQTQSLNIFPFRAKLESITTTLAASTKPAHYAIVWWPPLLYWHEFPLVWVLCQRFSGLLRF